MRPVQNRLLLIDSLFLHAGLNRYLPLLSLPPPFSLFLFISLLLYPLFLPSFLASVFSFGVCLASRPSRIVCSVSSAFISREWRSGTPYKQYGLRSNDWTFHSRPRTTITTEVLDPRFLLFSFFFHNRDAICSTSGVQQIGFPFVWSGFACGEIGDLSMQQRTFLVRLPKHSNI